MINYLACFKLLIDYVEQEHPFERINWSVTSESQHVADEIKVLYEWWKYGRKTDYDALNAIVIGNGGYVDKCGKWNSSTGPGWELYMERSNELEAKDDEMLDRLMKIRKYLWT